MLEGRIVVIPFLQGKLTVSGTVNEPDIDAIFAAWLERHPEFHGRERDYRIIRGTITDMEDDITTILVRVTAAVSPDLDAYDPAEDVDLYEEFLMEKEASPRRIPGLLNW